MYGATQAVSTCLSSVVPGAGLIVPIVSSAYSSEYRAALSKLTFSTQVASARNKFNYYKRLLNDQKSRAVFKVKGKEYVKYVQYNPEGTGCLAKCLSYILNEETSVDKGYWQPEHA